MKFYTYVLIALTIVMIVNAVKFNKQPQPNRPVTKLF